VGLAENAAAAQWLDTQLAHAAPDAWRILFLHEPPYEPGTKWVTRGLRVAFDRVLAGPAPPALVLAGHDHVYARADPLCTQASQGGTLEIISGGGGENLDRVHRQVNFPVVASVTHYLRVSVSRDTIDVRAVGVDGHLHDRTRLRRGATVLCRRDGWPPPKERNR